MSKLLKKDSKRLSRARTEADVGRRKQFSTADYDQAAPAVAAVLTHLHSLGVHAVTNPDNYGPDVIVYSGLRPSSYVEVEQRQGWRSGPWPARWDPVRIPERKWEMYTQLALPCSHWVVSADCTRSLNCYVDPTTTPAILTEVSNSVHQSGERFYCIALSEWSELTLLTSGDSTT
jgi:hypothetical protein